MSIASAITAAQSRVADAYTAISNKGGTLPATQNLANMPTAINSIPTGGGSGIGINREVSGSGIYQQPSTNFSFSLPSTATNMSPYVMYYVFRNCTGITSVDLSSLTSLTGTYALYYTFNGCTNITGAIDLSNLTTIDASSVMQNAFYGCTGITSVDLGSLVTVKGSYTMGSAFYGCTGITSIDLSSLTTVIENYAMQNVFYNCTGLTGTIDLSSVSVVRGQFAMSSMFRGCTNITGINLSGLTTIGQNNATQDYGQFTWCFHSTGITSITFTNLEKIYCTGGTSTSYGTFANNPTLEKLYFPKLTTITYGSGASSANQAACKNVFYGCSSLTELHFASTNKTAIESTPGYSTLWGIGAGSATVYFDL